MAALVICLKLYIHTYKRPYHAPAVATLWTQHRDADVRRLILEVALYRLVIKEVDGLYKSTHLAWRANVGGDLVALHTMLQVLTVERQRLP